MNFKQLEWASNGDVHYSLDTIPQMIYVIRLDWDAAREHRVHRVEFTHGYVSFESRRNYTLLVGRYDTVDEAKAAAQAHLEQYIKESFFL